MTELLSCPFCSGDRFDIDELGIAELSGVSVICLGCGTMGPVASMCDGGDPYSFEEQQDKAIKLWNKRIDK
jgi:Lar family restriction alleviation protein